MRDAGGVAQRAELPTGGGKRRRRADHALDGRDLYEARSFAASVKDPNKIHRQSLYTAYRQEIRTFLDQEYKLILYNVCYSGARYTQLFNIKKDPFETKNLAKEQPERVARMIEQARKVGRELGEDYQGKDPSRNVLMSKLRFWEYWDKRHDFGPNDVQNLPPKYVIDPSPAEMGD